MAQHVALLRAVNVGGRFVKMASLVDAFESLGLKDVRSVIASGNLLFRTPSRGAAGLAARIEGALQALLGYEVAAFLRSDSEWWSLARGGPPFNQEDVARSQALNVMFLAHELTDVQRDVLLALEGPIDRLAVQGREIFWLCAVRQSESKFSAALLERRLGLKTTVRTWTTVQKLAVLLRTH